MASTDGFVSVILYFLGASRLTIPRLSQRVARFLWVIKCVYAYRPVLGVYCFRNDPQFRSPSVSIRSFSLDTPCLRRISHICSLWRVSDPFWSTAFCSLLFSAHVDFCFGLCLLWVQAMCLCLFDLIFVSSSVVSSSVHVLFDIAPFHRKLLSLEKISDARFARIELSRCKLQGNDLRRKRLYTASTSGRSCGRATLQQHFKNTSYGAVLICEPTMQHFNNTLKTLQITQLLFVSRQ